MKFIKPNLILLSFNIMLLSILSCSKSSSQLNLPSLASPIPDPASQFLSADGGADRTVLQSTITLQSSIQNVAGNPLTYAWSKLSGSGSTITSPNTSTTSVTNLTAGIYVFRLSVSDGAEQMAVDDITVTVN